MSKSVRKQERGCALVCGTRKGHGRLLTRLTTPLRSRAFLMRPLALGVHMQARTEVEQSLHRLANYVEIQLQNIFQELLVDGRISDVSSIAWGGARFVESLREARDGKSAGGEV